MSESLVREIVDQVLREALLQNWRAYAVLIALLFLTSVAGAFVSTYIRRRAETYATKADLSQLITQLKATTAAAEEVKSAIAHTDWANREWRTLRRVKLEELLTTVHFARHWLDVDLNARFFGEKPNVDPSPTWKLEVLGSLYLPELQVETSTLGLAYSKYNLWMIDVQQALSEAGTDLAKRKAVFAARLPELATHQTSLFASISAMNRKAAQLMKEIVGV
jgi:hypothetical protein